MKRLLPLAPLLLLFALLLSPAAALFGARQGLSLWWGSVLPALLPSFLCLKLMQKLGLLAGGLHARGKLAAVAGFSLLSGAPNGAKLLQALIQDGVLSDGEGQWLLPFLNSVSPTFLLTIIASDLLKNKALFLPIAVPFYGCALCFSLPAILRKDARLPDGSPSPLMPFSRALSAAVEESMLDMLRIGGCIVCICTILQVAEPLVPQRGVFATLAGCMEVSVGTSVIAQLSAPLRVRVSLLAGVSAFGGMSLALQSLCCFPGLKLVPYLVRKLLFGTAVGLSCYLLFPLFPNVSSAFAGRQAMLARSLSLSALLLSSLLSAGFVFVLSLMVSPRKSR